MKLWWSRVYLQPEPCGHDCKLPSHVYDKMNYLSLPVYYNLSLSLILLSLLFLRRSYSRPLIFIFSLPGSPSPPPCPLSPPTLPFSCCNLKRRQQNISDDPFQWKSYLTCSPKSKGHRCVLTDSLNDVEVMESVLPRGAHAVGGGRGRFLHGAHSPPHTYTPTRHHHTCAARACEQWRLVGGRRILTQVFVRGKGVCGRGGGGRAR